MNAERKTPPTFDAVRADYDALAAQLAEVTARAEAAEAALARVQACPRYAVYAIGRETTFIEQQDDGEFQYAADVIAALSPEAAP